MLASLAVTPECDDALQQLSDDTARDHHVASISWGVVIDGELAVHGATGTVDDGRAIDEHTVYRIASMTKSFAAAAVLALRDEGVWQLDDPVARHAPELAAVRGPAGSPPITLRHLLCMASGLATDDAWADRHLDIRADEIDRIYAAGPTFARLPGTGFEYSNLGYGMLGRAVQRATGVRVQQHITERFLQPLGMSRTTWVCPDHDQWARPHRWRDDQLVLDEHPPLGDGEIAPMGGLWTTVADLSRWVAWLERANTLPDEPDAIGLSVASRREMQRIQTYIGNTAIAGRTTPAGYGFGLNVRDDPTLGMVVAHAGGLPGYGSNMRWLSGRGVGAIALGNITYAPMSEMTMRMLDLVHTHGSVPPTAPVAAPLLDAAASRLVTLVNAWDDEAALELFADNVALDEPFLRRASAAARLIELHGPLELVAVRPEVTTRGTLDVRGSGDVFTITVELSPASGAAVQAYEIHG